MWTECRLIFRTVWKAADLNLSTRTPKSRAAAANLFRFRDLKNLKFNLIALSFLVIFLSVLYHELWGKHLYLVTAYCDCPICINIAKFRDRKFASGRKTYWGGSAADSKISFGTEIELAPFWPKDFWKINRILRNRTSFEIEDRGGKIKGRHIDLFIPQSMGGHRTALKWGRQRMRIRLNGELAE